PPRVRHGHADGGAVRQPLRRVRPREGSLRHRGDRPDRPRPPRRTNGRLTSPRLTGGQPGGSRGLHDAHAAGYEVRCSEITLVTRRRDGAAAGASPWSTSGDGSYAFGHTTVRDSGSTVTRAK